MEINPSRKSESSLRSLRSGAPLALGLFIFGFVHVASLLAETPPTTAENSASTIESAQQTTQPAKPADPAPPLYETAQTVDYRLLVISAAGSLIFSFFYLGIKFSRFRGLRIYRNRWSVIWLLAATILSVIAAAGGQLGIQSSGVKSSIPTTAGPSSNMLWLLQMIVYPLGGGLLLPILSRFTPKSRSPTQQQVKEFQDLRISGYVLERISDDVFEQIVAEIDLVAATYDWHVLQRVVRRLIDTQLAMRSITRETADGLRRHLDQIQPVPDDRETDADNKYRFLTEALFVLPFCRLRSRLRKFKPEE
jgi:membrane protein implicated in regulation of membrane protease activity